LAVIGDGTVAEALAKLLDDPKMATYARTALEAIDDPACGEALLAATDRLDGELLIGVIGSIGKIRDVKAIGRLAELAEDSNSQVATAAARALGNIGTIDVIAPLTKLLESNGATQQAAAGSLLNVARRLVAAGEKQRAVGLCDLVRRSDLPGHIKDAATRGAIVWRGKDGIPHLRQLITSQDEKEFQIGLQIAREFGDGANDMLIEQFSSLSDSRQVKLILLFRDRAEPTLLPTILGATESENKEVRTRALAALSRFADAKAVLALLRASGDPDEEIAAAARGALGELQSNTVDQTIVEMLAGDDAAEIITACDIARRRGVSAATTTLLQLADGSEDTPVRTAAIAALGATVEPQWLPGLIQLWIDAKTDAERAAAVESLRTACARLPRESTVTALLGGYNKVSTERKVSLLEQIAAVGGKESLDAIIAAAKSENDALVDAATRLLGGWLTPDAAGPMIELARSITSSKYKIRVLRGTIRIARQFDMPPADRLAACRGVLELATREEEKILALEALPRVGDKNAIDLAATYLADPKLVAPAGMAILEIAERLRLTSPDTARAAVVRVVSALNNQSVSANELLARTKAFFATADEEVDFTSIFDGKTTDGWEGNMEWFRVEDSAIVAGKLTERIPRNEFLCTKKEYEDFELRLQFKVIGAGANAGIQIRSKRIPNHHEVSGYQADLGNNWWGCLYDESRRRRVLAGPPAPERAKPVRMGEWNDYRILCEGPRIRLWINGVATVDYTEEEANIPRNGIIGLQVHSGGPMEAWYRNIRVQEIDNSGQ